MVPCLDISYGSRLWRNLGIFAVSAQKDRLGGLATYPRPDDRKKKIAASIIVEIKSKVSHQRRSKADARADQRVLYVPFHRINVAIAAIFAIPGQSLPRRFPVRASVRATGPSASQADGLFCSGRIGERARLSP